MSRVWTLPWTDDDDDDDDLSYSRRLYLLCKSPSAFQDRVLVFVLLKHFLKSRTGVVEVMMMLVGVGAAMRAFDSRNFLSILPLPSCTVNLR